MKHNRPAFSLWLEVSVYLKAPLLSGGLRYEVLRTEPDFLDVKHNVLAYAFKVVCSCKALAESSYSLNLLSSSGFQIPFPVIPRFDLIARFGPCWYRLER